MFTEVIEIHLTLILIEMLYHHNQISGGTSVSSSGIPGMALHLGQRSQRSFDCHVFFHLSKKEMYLYIFSQENSPWVFLVEAYYFISEKVNT